MKRVSAMRSIPTRREVHSVEEWEGAFKPLEVPMQKTNYPQQHGQCFWFGKFGHVGFVSPGAATVLVNLALHGIPAPRADAGNPQPVGLRPLARPRCGGGGGCRSAPAVP